MPRRARRCSGFTVALTLLFLLQIATPAWAWGRLGHRVISRLAERYLTPQAKAAT
jgi:nuclease S1